MLCQVERAELCLIMKHVEILVVLVVVDQLYSDFILAVGKRTIFAVLTFLYVGGEVRTEFFFIGLVLIELLDSGVGVGALIPFRALFAFANVLAHVIAVEVAVSFSVLSIVVIYTVLMQVLLGVGTGVQLEVVDVEILNYYIITFTYFLCTNWYLRWLAWVMFVVVSLFSFSFIFYIL